MPEEAGPWGACVLPPGHALCFLVAKVPKHLSSFLLLSQAPAPAGLSTPAPSNSSLAAGPLLWAHPPLQRVGKAVIRTSRQAGGLGVGTPKCLRACSPGSSARVPSRQTPWDLGVLPVHQTIAPPTDVHAKASRFAPLVSGLDFSAHWVGGRVAGPGRQPAAWQRGWASGKAWAASWPRASGRRGKGEWRVAAFINEHTKSCSGTN